MKDNILIIGCRGQIGTELTSVLAQEYGKDRILATDIREVGEGFPDVPFRLLDALDARAVEETVEQNGIAQVYHLSAMLSAVGETRPMDAWRLNMETLLTVLNLAREGKIEKIFWPSSIGAFGPHTELKITPQYTVMDPDTVYGISKLSGELWCRYYHERYGVDVRSVRFPGIISWKAAPGGGTTDYAVDIFHKAVQGQAYSCFLREDTFLPMIYMPDALRAIVELMHAPAESLTVRTSYNLGAMSFSPRQLAEVIARRVPGFEIRYEPDFRQKIADTWPDALDDACARQDWGWKPQYDIEQMADDMLRNLRENTPGNSNGSAASGDPLREKANHKT